MRGLIWAGVAAAAVLAGSAKADVFSYSTDFSAGVGPEWTISAPQYQQDPGIIGEGSNSGAASYTLTLTSPGASTSPLNGSLTFDLLGFRTIDGAGNCCTDVFNLLINGSTRYQAAFGMGGGGSDQVFTNPDGATFSGSGQSRQITIPFTAVAGTNTFVFLYPALQGFGDEAFGLDNIDLRAVVNPPAGPGIPEPATWAMMLMGFFGLGALVRARRPLTA
jgi:hypothetical protein